MKTIKLSFKIAITLAVFCGLFWQPAAASAQEIPLEEILGYIETLRDWSMNDFATQERERLAKAEPDECFYGLESEPAIGFNPAGIDVDACIADGGQPKVNQAYVWGLAKTGDNLWFGTAPNTHCLVIGGYLGMGNDILTDSYVCQNPPYGDFRPPKIYMYNTATRTLVDKTPSPLDVPLINATMGIRSAGTLGDVVFLAGPGFGGINMFAFNTQTGDYIDSCTLDEEDVEGLGEAAPSNIRKWLVVNDILYTAIGAGDGGAVLKWTGSLEEPFQFEVVGFLDSAGAELAEHAGRIFVSTWPGGGELNDGGNEPASLYMSPLIPEGGLPADTGKWVRVWNANDYEPDPVTAMTYGGGALVSYGGYLYWGTMHVPMMATLAHFMVYGDYFENYPGDTSELMLTTMLGSMRAITIFRAQNFDTPVEPMSSVESNIELVYGMPLLPAFLPSVPVKDDMPPEMGWRMVPNKMCATPLYGPSGLGNPFNNYTWTMAVYNDQMYVGTMDWSYLIFGNMDISLPEEMPFDCEQFPEMDCDLMMQAWADFVDVFDPTRLFGADLFRFSDASLPAIPESLAGVCNYTSYGIRTMVSDDALYLGMANPMNLLTDTTDDIPEGGWELMKLAAPGLRGDLNFDGAVTPDDIQVMTSHLNEPACFCTACDLNDDGEINILDTRALLTENPSLSRTRRPRRR